MSEKECFRECDCGYWPKDRCLGNISMLYECLKCPHLCPRRRSIYNQYLLNDVILAV